MSAYEVRRFDELDAIAVAGVEWRPVRRPLGITAFGMNAYTGDAGEHVVEEHTEEQLGHEEVYVVVSGAARFTLGEDEVDVAAGGFVYVRDPGTRRVAVATADGTVVLAVGGRPGAHEPSAWEWFFEAKPLRDAGDHEGALEIVRDGLRLHPDSAGMLYNVARCEAMLGRPDAALDHLRRAIERDDQLAGYALEDESFASIADRPEFLAVTGQPQTGSSGA